MAESQHNDKEFLDAVHDATAPVEREPYQRDGRKVDFDPSNDYQDGYNAGRRSKDLRKREHILMAFAAGQIATIIAYFWGKA
ncbi:hypothetical protein GCM10027080_05860 [Pedococcus soli]